MKLRDAILYILIGAPGTGKTTWLINRLMKLEMKRKILIYDPGGYGDERYSKFDRITDLKKNWSGIRVYTETDYVKALKELEILRNCMIILDDCVAYAKTIRTKETSQIIENMLMRRRHLSQDIIMIYHDVNIVPVYVWNYTPNKIILFHIESNPSNWPSKAYGIDKLIYAHKLLKASNKPFQFAIIDLYSYGKR